MQNRLASAGPEDLHERPVQVRATVAVDGDVHNALLHKTHGIATIVSNEGCLAAGSRPVLRKKPAT